MFVWVVPERYVNVFFHVLFGEVEKWLKLNLKGPYTIRQDDYGIVYVNMDNADDYALCRLRWT